MRSHPEHPVNTEEEIKQFFSIFEQRDKTQLWQICLSPMEKDRSAAQRALDWVWNREIASRTDGSHSVKYIHGLTKLQILLPLYLEWGGKREKRAIFLYQVINRLPNFAHKVGVAFDMVRTSDLTIKQMAEYLTKKQAKFAEQGIVLESNDDLEFKSLVEAA